MDGQTDRQTEKRAPMSHSQEVREMFHAKYSQGHRVKGSAERRMSRRNTMQGLKVLATIVDEIARVIEIVDGWTDRKPDAYVAPCQQVRQKVKELQCS